ncbi:lipase chaperone LimK [Sinobacterium caligoides]|uniref:Lipase chaperone n=1 Tax=Sinobacterium caligoides TaxID=933926 RepID=A0A3N2DQG2_9GAMM|nr:lipase secretion chaperone [Sinobacterium caligoides]ROS02017.1 lipase chaperone LimK [Sinobacterium caligoides]
MARPVTLAVTCLGLAVAGYLLLEAVPVPPSVTATPAVQQPTTLRAPQATEQTTQQRPMKTTAPDAGPANIILPKAIAGLDIDGNILLDSEGRIVVEQQLRDLFEFFLSLQGDWSLEEIQQYFPLVLAQQGLDPATLVQAEQLFQHYIDYKTALSDLASQTLDPWQLLQARQQIQLQYFQPEQASALFADENNYMAYSLNKYYQQDLDENYRQTMIDDDRQQLSEQDRRSIDRYQQSQQQLSELKALQQLNTTERQQARIELVGEVATGRLEQLDQQRLQWRNKIEQLQQHQQQLDNIAGLAEQDRQQQRDDYIAEHFSDSEQRRLQSWTKINQAAR